MTDSTPIDLGPERVATLAAKLDGLDGLTEEDRIVAALVFALAREALDAAGAEVEGFTYLPGISREPSQDLVDRLLHAGKHAPLSMTSRDLESIRNKNFVSGAWNRA